MSSVKQPQILSLRIDNLERRLAKSEMSDGPILRRLVLSATDELRLVCGAASLTLKKDGTVIIRAKDFDVSASGDANIKAAKELKLKGAKILQN
jgi:hypothetical protein